MAFDLSKFAATVPSLAPRTIETVTGEILEIKQRVSEDFLELGRKLIEAKELLPHGEWGAWLEREVDFSERTAQRFMTLAQEYGSNPELAARLGSSKAFALLSVPAEKREEIIEHGVEIDGKPTALSDLSSRKIHQIAREEKSKKSEKLKPKTDSAVGFEEQPIPGQVEFERKSKNYTGVVFEEVPFSKQHGVEIDGNPTAQSDLTNREIIEALRVCGDSREERNPDYVSFLMKQSADALEKAENQILDLQKEIERLRTELEGGDKSEPK